MTASVPHRRVRPWLRRLAIVFFAILVPVALWSAWDYFEARRIRTAVDEIRRRGEPVALQPRDTWDSRNAGNVYVAAAMLLDRKPLGGSTGIMTALRYEREGHAAAMARVRAWLAENAESERLVHTGTNLPFVGFPVGIESSLRWDRMSTLMTLAAMRRIERLDAGDAPAAASALIDELAVARSLSFASSWPAEIVHSQTAGALADLAAFVEQHPPDDSLAQVQAAITAHDADDAVERTALNARAFLIEQFWNPGRGWYGRPRVRFEAGDPFGPMLYVVLRPWFANRMHAELGALTQAVAEARQPWPNRLGTERGTPQPEPSRGLVGVLKLDFAVGSMRYLQRRQVAAAGSTLAYLRTATTAIAVQRYRLRHDGALPTSLDALVPELLPMVPTDPFSGGPVRYRADADRYVVYSVGQNGTDNGGDTHRRVQGAPGYQRPETKPDIGFQVELKPTPAR